ncbi:hypothetical protein MHI08_04355 [Bacillus sp. FSL M7-0791]|uniref:hypothetical protein n=1 Tax=Bacillus TaxID=1386 RepID=UPI003159F0E7
MKIPKLELFAVNLRTPSHMEWTNDNRLLVSEHTSGEVKDITDGGDFKDVQPFASNLQGPSSILPLSDGRILISEMWGNRISEISSGGLVTNENNYTTANSPYSLVKEKDKILVTEREGTHTLKIVDISDFNNKKTIIKGIPFNLMPGLEGLTPLKSWPENWRNFSIACAGWKDGGDPDPDSHPLRAIDKPNYLLASCSLFGHIYTIPEGENHNYLDLIEQEKNLLFTGLDWAGGMHFNKTSSKLYVTQPLKGTVLELDLDQSFKKPLDCRFIPPIIKGLNMPTCIRFSPNEKEMYVCSMPIGAVWRLTNFI